MSTPVDHLIFGTPNLQDGIDYLEDLLGVRAILGGSHPGLGTCNALLSLGPKCYLEIMAPDPIQVDFSGTRPFGIDDLGSGQLVGWIARRDGLSQFVQTVKSRGIELGDIIPISRETPEGDLLEWEMSYVNGADANVMSLLPLFIDWGKTPHPAIRCKESAQLISLEINYPTPLDIEPFINALELEVNINEGLQPRLRALINCPRGKIEMSN